MALYTTILNYRKKRVRGKVGLYTGVRTVRDRAVVAAWRRHQGGRARHRPIVLRPNLNTMRLRDSAASPDCGIRNSVCGCLASSIG